MERPADALDRAVDELSAHSSGALEKHAPREVGAVLVRFLVVVHAVPLRRGNPRRCRRSDGPGRSGRMPFRVEFLTGRRRISSSSGTVARRAHRVDSAADPVSDQGNPTKAASACAAPSASPVHWTCPVSRAPGPRGRDRDLNGAALDLPRELLPDLRQVRPPRRSISSSSIREDDVAADRGADRPPEVGDHRLCARSPSTSGRLSSLRTV